MNADEWATIRALHDKGETIHAISRTLSMSRNSVRRALQVEMTAVAGAPPRSYDEYDSSEADASQPKPLHSSGARAHLPVMSTTFVGRRDELASLQQRLGEYRLVTVSGPGGIGKTRLAVQAATDFRRAFADGVRFVELADIRHPDLLVDAVMGAVGLTRRFETGQAAVDALVEFLEAKQFLIVLDNCEHLIEACAGLTATLLRSTKGIRILATSRERFASPHEYVLELRPLAVGDGARPDSAMSLFEGRARAVLGDFDLDDSNRAVVRSICAKIDGVPLAIELACARLTSLSLDQLAERLDHRLDLLTTGNRSGPERHRSMTATIEWSFDQCTRDEQLLWSRASVFAGGFDLEMAEQVCAGGSVGEAAVLDSISGLVAKSIIQRERTGRHIRFRMLEAIREFGDARLRFDERELLRHGHAAWCNSFLSRVASEWFTEAQPSLNADLRANRANIRLALDYVLDRRPRDLSASAMLTDVWFLWTSGVSLAENRMWLERAVQVSDHAVHRARAFTQLALLAVIQGQRSEANGFLESAENQAALLDDHAAIAFNVHIRGLNESFAGHLKGAQEYFDRAVALYSPVEPRPGLKSTLHFHLGMHYFQGGRTDLASYHYEVARERCSSAGESWLLAHTLCGIAGLLLTNGNPVEGLERAREALRLIQVFDDAVGVALTVDLLGWCSAAVGQHERAAVLFGAADAMWDSFGARLYNSAVWLALKSKYETAVEEGLGAEIAARSRLRGAAMTVAEAIDFGLANRAPADSAVVAGQTNSRAAALSPRELEVAEHLMRGLSNKDIADRLVLSHRTIEGHVERVLRKLNITNRNQVASVLLDDHIHV